MVGGLTAGQLAVYQPQPFMQPLVCDLIKSAPNRAPPQKNCASVIF